MVHSITVCMLIILIIWGMEVTFVIPSRHEIDPLESTQSVCALAFAIQTNPSDLPHSQK